MPQATLAHRNYDAAAGYRGERRSALVFLARRASAGILVAGCVNSCGQSNQSDVPTPNDSSVDTSNVASMPLPSMPLPDTGETAPSSNTTTVNTDPGTGTGTPAETSAEPPQLGAVPNEGRLLTRVQYDTSVRDIFMGLVHGPFTTEFPTENEVMGFATNARSHRASSWLVESHLLASEAVAKQVVSVLPQLLPCAQETADAACAHAFVDEYGERAFRRELTSEERAPLLQLADELIAVEGFEPAIELVVQALLQSPQFLYRMEYARDLEADGVFRVSDAEMASRLSYFFWNSIPDDELREFARNGRLHELVDIEQQARRLAADPRTQSHVARLCQSMVGHS
jgi:hypothetical protein